MSETGFMDVKVGDKVWDLVYGWGTVTSALPAHTPFDPMEGVYFGLPIQVDFPLYSQTVWYARDGSCAPYFVRRLFWHEVKIEPPPRPKRKVKKTIWVRVFQSKFDLAHPYVVQCPGEADHPPAGASDAINLELETGSRFLSPPIPIHYEAEE